MIGAVSIVFTDLFILNGARVMWWEKTSKELPALPVDIVNLKTQNQYYLKNGIDLPDVLTVDKALPDIVLQGNDNKNDGEQEFANLSPLDTIVANIEPAIGVDADKKASASKVTKNNNLDIEKVILNISSPEEDVVLDKKLISKTEELVAEDKSYKQYSYTAPQVKGKIVIIIDDMGVSLTSKLVEIMPAPLTLSYLPYAKNLQERTEKASKNGHEIMLHLPMEPMSKYKDAGSHVLKVSQSEEALLKDIEWNLSQFKGYVGVNNHMGSRMTQDKRAMDQVMKYLKKRNLFFIDSRTIGNSVAAQSARDYGLDYAKRDVFIDHEITEEFVNNALKKLEDKALRNGYAIAIGHPHKVTIKVLKEWLPTLKDKGLTLVPASSVLYRAKENNDIVYNRAN